MPIYSPIDLSRLKTYPLSERTSMVSVRNFSKPWEKDASFARFLDTLPRILAGNDVREVISSIVDARNKDKPVLMGMGAHVIKVGLNPIVIDLMERGVITAVAMNGAGIIHDLEVAMTGRTSEDVAAALKDGTFGMAHETGVFLSHAISAAAAASEGLGSSVGRQIIEKNLPLKHFSILGTGFRLGIPVTVHIALGTDIIHLHPKFDPGAAGIASHLDFRTFSAIVADMEGGVYLNVGSAVILPEVFLKAVTLVRNLGFSLQRFTTVNMDFIRQYRPMANVVSRPTSEGGKGFNLVGHHEILLPLMAAGIIEAMEP